MGTSKTALVALAALAVATPSLAHAECTRLKANGERFATCFDIGNQLFVSASSDGFGGGVRLRHVMRFEDEPDLVWKLDHRLLNVQAGGLRSSFDGALYSGRFLRHARDGHIILPFGIPKKLFLPFDIGAEAEVGRIRGLLGDERLEIGVVRAVALVDLSRTASLKRRLSIGAVVRWDVEVIREGPAIEDNTVVPFSTGLVNGYLESESGLTVAEVSAEAGTAWTQSGGWGTELRANLMVERTLIALNERPLSLFGGLRYESRDDQFVAQVGLRMALIQRRDRRTIGLQP